MNWIALAVPISAILGALIGGVVTLIGHATTAQHNVADEFSKLSASQATQIDNLHAELARVRERIVILEREEESMRGRYAALHDKYDRVCAWMHSVVEWDREGRQAPLPTTPNV